MERKPYPTDLTDAQWVLIELHLPPQPAHGRRRRHDRQVLNAILYVMRTGCRWCDLPHDLGDDSTAHRWLLRWMEDGVWEKIWFAMLRSLDERQKLDWATALLDGSFVPAKKGGRTLATGAKAKARRST
jgi:putative transposase